MKLVRALYQNQQKWVSYNSQKQDLAGFQVIQTVSKRLENCVQKGLNRLEMETPRWENTRKIRLLMLMILIREL
jgi:hypothetical protein